MTIEEVTNGLKQLGFNSGWVVSGSEIVLWENAEPQPSLQEIEAASKLYVKPEPTVADKLASVGLSVDDLKSALGL
jgi:hypothetical protein